MIFGITITKDYDLLEVQMMVRIFCRKVFFLNKVYMFFFGLPKWLSG